MKEQQSLLRQEGLIEMSSALIARLRVLFLELSRIDASARLIDTAKLENLTLRLQNARDAYLQALNAHLSPIKPLPESKTGHGFNTKAIGTRMPDKQDRHSGVSAELIGQRKADLRQCLVLANNAYESLIEPLLNSLGDDPADTLVLKPHERGSQKAKIVIRVK